MLDFFYLGCIIIFFLLFSVACILLERQGLQFVSLKPKMWFCFVYLALVSM